MKIDPHGQLSELQQSGSLRDYQNSFEKLCNQVKGVAADHPLGTFLSGLRDELQYEVRSFNPTTLADAMRIARFQDAKIKAWKKAFRVQDDKLPLHPLPSKPPPPTKKLTPEELDEKRRKGLCCSCDQKWFKGQV
uniref:Protein kinase C zeta type n=1 Tax=Anthurium amnicola TaxID=1678845 RepID=A0A1D1Z5R5_9ARAE